jgi:hypothetical protein
MIASPGKLKARQNKQKNKLSVDESIYLCFKL